MSIVGQKTTIFEKGKETKGVAKVKVSAEKVLNTDSLNPKPEKKEFKCQFYNKDLGGCGVKCPKNRNICCNFCILYDKCITVEEIAAEICDQVKECK